MDGRISNPAQLCSVRRYTVGDGKECGLKFTEVNNGRLRFLLNESKALDISQLWFNGMNMSFLSKNGLSAATDTPFSRSFEGGMLYTCGLDSVGDRKGFRPHGSFHNIPSKIISAEADGKFLKIVACTEDTALFGKNLIMFRTVGTEIGSGTLSISDRLVNRGTDTEQYCLLYHVNLGFPMLDEGVKIISDTLSVAPRTERAAKMQGHRTVFLPPEDNAEECCYFITHKSPEITAINEKMKIAFTLKYSSDTLPCFVQWNSNASGDYALGLEPSTTFLDDRFSFSEIRPDEEKEFNLLLTFKNI